MYHLCATCSPSNIFPDRARALTDTFRRFVLSLSLHEFSHRHQNLRLPKYTHTKTLMYSFVCHLLLMDVTIRIAASTSLIIMPTRKKKMLEESGCHIRTIDREPRIPGM
jgi:hypothetical protein